MNFGFKHLLRPSLIFAAILVITPNWASAQIPAAARDATMFHEILRPNLSMAGPSESGLIADDVIGPTPHVPDSIDSDLTNSDPLLANLIASDPIQPAAPLVDLGLSDLPDEGHSPAEPLAPFAQPADINAVNVTHGMPHQSTGYCPHCGMAKPTRHFHVTAGESSACPRCGRDVHGRPSYGHDLGFRFGWWGVESDGSSVRVGEYQDLASSPFWDLDGVVSTGTQTLDFTLTGLDNEANNARGYFYGGPGLAVKFEYDRFLRRLDHLPLNGFDINSGTPGPSDNVVADDLNVGDDYAIRVQRLETRTKGRLTKNLKWKVDLWAMRKSGERQASAMAHCFNINPPPAGADYTCHVLSQQQRIDWTTLEITPALSATVGKASVEYSRTMRAFGQNDQVVDRTYTDWGYSPSFGVEGAGYAYGWVPESFTQIDRLKLNVPLNDTNQLYAHVYLGDTENKFRGTHRDFDGFDLRVTNRQFDDVTLTAYGKLDSQDNDLPTNLLTTVPFGIPTGPAGGFEPDSLRHPIEYDNGRIGLKGRWQSPSRNWFSIAGGYEFGKLHRKFADYNTLSGPFSQQDTETHLINVGPYFRVSETLDTFVRYKGGFTDNPLIGVREADGRFNSNQPEQDHRVEIGGTWTPMSNLMATGQVGIENSWHDSQYANFQEDNYPIVGTLWYAPTDRLSLTGGYAYLSNWIDQDITIGFLNNPTETTQWNYGGYSNFCSGSFNYAYSQRTQLVGGIEWNRGSNVFFVPTSTAGADWTALPSFADVIVETTRINLGIDYQFRSSVSSYFRYVYFDYEDFSEDFNSGTATMFLAGFTLLR